MRLSTHHPALVLIHAGIFVILLEPLCSDSSMMIFSFMSSSIPLAKSLSVASPLDHNSAKVLIAEGMTILPELIILNDVLALAPEYSASK